VTGSIRTARPGDHEAILGVVQAAFTSPSHDGAEEVEIVRTTWRLGAAPPELDLLAADGRDIIGHAIAGRGRLGLRETVGLAPLAVVPSRQRQGVGTALVSELIRRAEAAMWPMVLVLGDPRYYARFGFEPASRFGIVYPQAGEDDPHFQVCRLSRFDASWSGAFVYCWEL